MKLILSLALFGITSALVDIDDASLDTKVRFAAWKEQVGKTYATDEEESSAYWVWRQNDHKVQEHNEQGLSYTLGHNEFSDMTSEEFHSKYVGSYLDNPNLYREMNYVTLDATAAPDSIDWSTKGAVTPIKNQGQCGSCWAFSTTGSVEGDYFISAGKLVSLSEQDLVSCDHNGDQGCNGGLMDNAFGWIAENGICTEEAYPYTSGSGTSGTCKKTCTPAVTITGHTDVPKNDETSLKAAAANQPVSVAIEADKSAFQLYKSGVFDDASCGTQLDHGVLVVGYGTESGKDYWKVKNSWGATWGLNGYILMARGKNMCGISLSASYPTGAKAAGGSSPSPSTPSPSPSVGPSPSPSGPAPDTHYGDPKNGCMSDEIKIQITGVQGDICSPACTGIFKTKCPTDVPAGVTAEPECALKDTSDDKYCALICSPSADDITEANDAQCGDNASCKAISGVGICTYDD